MNPTIALGGNYAVSSNVSRKSLTKTLLLSALFAGLASSVLPAHAQDYYVGGDLVFDNYNLDDGGANSSVGSSGHSQSWKLLAGYNFDKTWAIETGYVHFGSANYSVSGNSGTGNLRITADSLYVAAKSTVALNDSFSLYSKVGLARNHVDWTSSGVLETVTPSANKGSLYLGFGAQYKLSQNVDVTLGLDHFGTSDSVGNGSTVVSTGLHYSF